MKRRFPVKILKAIETTLWIATAALVLGGIIAYCRMAAAFWREGRIFWSVVAFLPIALPVAFALGATIWSILSDIKQTARERRRLSDLLDDRVSFTAYKPDSIRPEAWYPMLVFAFKAIETPTPGMRATAPSPEVRRQADAYFGDQAESFPPTSEESDLPVPKGANIRLVLKQAHDECLIGRAEVFRI